MKKYLKIGFLIYAVTQLSACSISQLTTRVAMPLIDGGFTAMNMESDLQLAGSALPANISLVEGMLINDPGNETLQLYAAQAYYGYAFGFIEDHDPAVQQSSMNAVINMQNRFYWTTESMNKSSMVN
ncbi:MAG: TRAP transporter TatT component family protein [gamma proteobacterium symbiont of Lucinoma myriamae]|nr:TRAP transporter TatT component family protein [gamma proteobacterium symbiont of Lucinoma myriamae]MCU7818782.1 TRAP transporter TatT component family protein [gamma proteobacterium symbiont of Lucinoma myriamae]MCU7833214.1 TRAP transporter TatT component family protein [gamma proteobacterium symbiont of Lucinoma myriamae]